MLGAKGAGVPTPNRVDAIEIKNSGEAPVKITVAYDDHKNKTEILEEAEVAAGATHLFGEKILDMGSWQAIAPVKHVTSSGASNSPLVPSVSGIVKKLVVEVKSGGALEQHAH